MKHKRFWLRIFIMALVLGAMVIGCNKNIDKSLNGTWVADFEEDGIQWKEEWKLLNGNNEVIIDSVPANKGTYYTTDGKIISKRTHFYDALELKWYSEDEAKIARPELTENKYMFSLMFSEITREYDINGNTLTIKNENGIWAYTKKK